MSRNLFFFELVLSAALFGFFVYVIFIAIDPFREWSKENNVNRYSEIFSISTAITQYSLSHHNDISTLHIPKVVSGKISSTELNLCSQLVPQFLTALPEDPSINKGKPIANCSANYDTGYTIIQDPKYSRITIAAPLAELDETIEVTQ